MTRRVYDKSGLSQVLDNGTVAATYAYYDNSGQRRVTYSNNVVEEFTCYYDNNLKTLSNRRGSQILEAYNYLYDANGNLTKSLTARVQQTILIQT